MNRIWIKPSNIFMHQASRSCPHWPSDQNDPNEIFHLGQEMWISLPKLNEIPAVKWPGIQKRNSGQRGVFRCALLAGKQSNFQELHPAGYIFPSGGQGCFFLIPTISGTGLISSEAPVARVLRCVLDTTRDRQPKFFGIRHRESGIRTCLPLHRRPATVSSPSRNTEPKGIKLLFERNIHIQHA